MRNLQFINVYAVCATIIALTVIILLIVDYNKDKKIAAELASAKSSAEEANKKSQTATEELLVVKELIDSSYGQVDVARIKDEHGNDMKKYVPDIADSHNYRFALSKLYDELDASKKNHEETKLNYKQLEANYKNLQKLYDTIITKHDSERTKAIADLEQQRVEFKNTLNTFSTQITNLEGEKIAIQTKADQDIKTANDTASNERKRAENAEKLCSELGSKLQQLLRPIFDRPDGVVEIVDLNTRAVVVDIGYADGVESKMTFSVYDSKIAGISYDSSLYGDSPVLCEACKRNVKLHASKASIEITKILGPHKSEARIIVDQLVNPILVGDVIHSPIWDRGQKLRIALGAGMFLPEVGNPASDPSLGSLVDIKNMIIECGGTVDSYISDGRSDSNTKRGEIIGLDNITADTSFIVIGTTKENEQENEIMIAQDTMRKKARALAVKEISLKELMLKLGWRNPTPLRDYGTEANEYDLKIKPEGGQPRSTGIVSPIYDKPNYSAGVSLNDRTKNISTGKVSDLYLNNPSKSLSTGNVSDLFRTRRKPNSEFTPRNP
ncbi:MAG: hypothetical protein LBE18_09035 [Planctomycetaceae bacterium]|jgi:hypothetical protein|nr:hypothetical protein [Planctomycetaceae bacterium]